MNTWNVYLAARESSSNWRNPTTPNATTKLIQGSVKVRCIPFLYLWRAAKRHVPNSVWLSNYDGVQICRIYARKIGEKPDQSNATTKSIQGSVKVRCIPFLHLWRSRQATRTQFGLVVQLRRGPNLHNLRAEIRQECPIDRTKQWKRFRARSK